VADGERQATYGGLGGALTDGAMTKIIAVLLIAGQSRWPLKHRRGSSSRRIPTPSSASRSSSVQSEQRSRLNPVRFYPCAVYDGPVRDLFDSPLAERIGLVQNLRTGPEGPGYRATSMAGPR